MSDSIEYPQLIQEPTPYSGDKEVLESALTKAFDRRVTASKSNLAKSGVQGASAVYLGNKLDSFLNSIGGAIQEKKERKRINPTRSKMLEHSPESVYIVQALGGKLENMKKGASGFMKGLMTALIGGGLLTAGIGAVISGLFDEGPFKGLKKLVGRALTNLGTGILKPILARAKNAIWSLGESIIKPFRSIFDSLIKNLGGFGGKLFGGFGKGPIGKAFGKVFKFVSRKAGKLMKFLKFMPGIGSLVSFGFAISRFKNGDVMGGILELAAGVADLFPGIGTAVSWGLDILLAARDLGAFGNKNKGQGGAVDVFKKIWKWIKEKGGPLVPAIGGIASNLLMGAFEWMKDMVNGLFRFAGSGIRITGEWLQTKLLDPALNWVSEKISSIRNSFQVATSWVQNNIVSPVGEFFGKVKNGITSAWDSVKDWIDTRIVDPIRSLFSGIMDIFAELRLQIARRTAFMNIGTSGDDIQKGMDALRGIGLSASQQMEVANQVQASRGLNSLQDALKAIGQMNRDDLRYRYGHVDSVNDAIIKPSGQIIHTNPNDTLIAAQMDRQTTMTEAERNAITGNTYGPEIVAAINQLIAVMQNKNVGGNTVIQQTNNTQSAENFRRSVME